MEEAMTQNKIPVNADPTVGSTAAAEELGANMYGASLTLDLGI